MVDIFDEVEEELREERMQALLKKYAGLLIVAALLVIGSVAAWKAWAWYQERRDVYAAASYLSATTVAESPGVATPGRPAAISVFQSVAIKAPGGYRVLAQLQEAALRADSNDLQGASALWDDVASDGSADSLLRGLANLTWCIHHADTGDPSLIGGRLKPLAAADSVWRPLALEQLALLDLRQGRSEAAKTQLKQLAEDVTAEAGVRSRAGILLNRIGG